MILVSATAAPGYLLEKKLVSKALSDVTYHNQISRLMQRHCVEYHREGGVGPFALDTYEDVVAHVPMMREVVDRGIMPPWFAVTDKSHPTSPWINDRSLSASEKQQLSTWIENKTPADDPKQSPVPRYDLISGSETRTMLDIPRYNFNWQLLYRYAEPVSVKASDTLRFTAWYDNSSGNHP